MKKYLAILLAAFAVITLFLSTSVIFDLFGVREKEGNYVPFVVWANFIVSLGYLVSAYGWVKARKWAVSLLLGMALLLAAAFIGLQFHIQAGGIYETKTVGALIFRTALTLVFAGLTHFTIRKKFAQ